MKVCIRKDNKRQISGPCNDIEVMKQDAINSGLTEDEIEFIEADEWVEGATQEEIDELRQQSMLPTLEERIEVLEQYALEQIFREVR
jgi:hypothetical protein